MKKFLLITCILIGVGIASFFLIAKKGYELTISPQQINENLKKSFPIEETYFDIVNVTYHNPQTTVLTGEQRLQIAMDVTTKISLGPIKREFQGKTIANSGIRYDSAKQEFYLSNAELANLSIDGIPPKYLKEISQRSADLLKPFSERFAIYELQADGAAAKAAGLLIKSVNITDEGVVVTLGL